MVYPGRSSAAAGPDFRDAILMSAEGRLLRGDVELHLRAGGWQAHGHQRDRRYNGVILHMVLWPHSGSQAGSNLEMGARVPTAALFPSLVRHNLGDGELAPALALVPGRKDRLGQLLGRAGDGRFHARARSLARLLSASAAPGTRQTAAWSSAPEEVLYQGLMEALVQQEPGALYRPGPAAASVLPGASRRRRSPLGPGFGSPVDAPGGRGVSRNPTSGTDLATGISPVVPQGGWHLFRVRPDNHPRRRLMGVALFLDWVQERGLLTTLTGDVHEADVAAVRGLLTVAGAPAGRGRREAAYIGPGRAGEMAVNVLLPFCATWEPNTGDSGLASASGRCTGHGLPCRRTRSPGR